MAPFSSFEDFDDCLDTMTEEGHDEQASGDICGALQSEAKADNGDVSELRDALERGAGLIADVGVDLVSGVDVPAIDSKWVAMKTEADGHDYQITSPLLKAESDTEQRITYAAAMIPREPDKEGDVAPTPTVEKAAHQFFKGDGGIDTDHSLIDGEGDPVESWVLKEERTFDLPDGGEEDYPEGTWMLGVEWGAEAWDRIQAGELTGLSIYGMAEHVPLERAACGCTAATAKQLDIPLANDAVVHLVYESRTAAEKASEEIGLDGDVHGHEFDGMDVWMPGATHEDFVERYMELSDEADETEAPLTATKERTDETPATHITDGDTDTPMGDETTDNDKPDEGGPDIETVAASVDDLAETVADVTDSLATVKDAVETEKQDARDAAELLAEEFGLESADAVLDAVESKANDDEDEDDEDEEEMESAADDGGETADTEPAEKRADDANLSKGGDGTATAAKGIDTDAQGTQDLSYRALAEQEGGD